MGKRVRGAEKQHWGKVVCLGVWRMVLRVQDLALEGSCLPWAARGAPMLFSLAASYRRDQEPCRMKGRPSFPLPRLWLIVSPSWWPFWLTALQV